jgi:hypothetical protein
MQDHTDDKSHAAACARRLCAKDILAEAERRRTGAEAVACAGGIEPGVSAMSQIWPGVQVFADPAEHVSKYVFTAPDAVCEAVL